MKNHFKFTTLRKNIIPFILLMIFAVMVQLFGGGEWSISDMIKANFAVAVMWIFSTLVTDWLQIKNSNFVGIKRFFKFTSFRESFHFFILTLSIFTVGLWHNGDSASQILRADFIIAVVGVFGSLLIDWTMKKNENVKE